MSSRHTVLPHTQLCCHAIEARSFNSTENAVMALLATDSLCALRTNNSSRYYCTL